MISQNIRTDKWWLAKKIYPNISLDIFQFQCCGRFNETCYDVATYGLDCSCDVNDVGTNVCGNICGDGTIYIKVNGYSDI